MFFEKRQHIFIEHVDPRDRQFARVQSAPGITGVAINDGLQIDATDTLQGTDKECVHGHQVAGVTCFDVTLTELGAELFQ